MSPSPRPKRNDSPFNHPPARKLSEASHCNHSTLVFIHSMAITARKRRPAPQERLLTCLTVPRRRPLLQWPNEIRYPGLVNHTHLESPVLLPLLQPSLDFPRPLLERNLEIPRSLLGCNHRAFRPAHEPTRDGRVHHRVVVVTRGSSHGAVLVLGALRLYQLLRQRKSPMSMRGKYQLMINCITALRLKPRSCQKSPRSSKMLYLMQ